MRDLKINEIIEITGGDEPAYGIGYLTVKQFIIMVT